MTKKLHLATTYGIMLNKVTPKSICEAVADLFEFPCNYSPCEEELHDEPWKMDWCEMNCGKATAAECWLHYFQIMANKPIRKEVKDHEK